MELEQVNIAEGIDGLLEMLSLFAIVPQGLGEQDYVNF